MLTPEQIEIQRRKFERVNPVPDMVEFNSVTKDYLVRQYAYEVLVNRSKVDRYIAKWRGWLSCAESNEIELPSPSYSMDSMPPIYMYNGNSLVATLEKQGFKVKERV